MITSAMMLRTELCVHRKSTLKTLSLPIGRSLELACADCCRMRHMLKSSEKTVAVLGAPALDLLRRYALRRAARALATVLGQIAEQAIHLLVIGRVENEPPILAGLHHPCIGELLQMEGKSRGRQVQSLCDRARGQALGPLLHQHSIDRKPRALRQGSQRFDCLWRFHCSMRMCRWPELPQFAASRRNQL